MIEKPHVVSKTLLKSIIYSSYLASRQKDTPYKTNKG